MTFKSKTKFYLAIWISWTIVPFCKGQTVLTGSTGSVCPGSMAVYTCESTTVTAPSAVWVLDPPDDTVLNFATDVSALNGVVEQPDIRFIIFGNSSESTVFFQLKIVNLISFNGTTVHCTIGSPSAILTIFIRDPVPPVISSLEATSSPGGQDSPWPVTLLTWMSTPEADSYTVTITPPPPGQSGSVMSSTTNVIVSLSYNQSYSISVYGVNCGMSGDSVSVDYIIVQCDEPYPPKNGVIGSASGRIEGATLMFQCNPGFTPVGLMTSVCTPSGTWSPDPTTFQCSPVTCPVLSTHANGSSNFSSNSSLVGTRVQFQCDPGLFPEEVRTAICLESGQWDNDLSQLVCRERPVNCSVPSNPVNGVILNSADLNTTEGSVITFQCDPGFSPAAEMTATCNNSGLWSPDPALLMCLPEATVLVDPPPIAPIVGGVVGGLIAVIVVILTVIVILVVFLVRRVKETQREETEGHKAPVGPMYEEVGPVVPPREMDIELQSNQAYGQLKKV